MNEKEVKDLYKFVDFLKIQVYKDNDFLVGGSNRAQSICSTIDTAMDDFMKPENKAPPEPC